MLPEIFSEKRDNVRQRIAIFTTYLNEDEEEASSSVQPPTELLESLLRFECRATTSVGHAFNIDLILIQTVVRHVSGRIARFGTSLAQRGARLDPVELWTVVRPDAIVCTPRIRAGYAMTAIEPRHLVLGVLPGNEVGSQSWPAYFMAPAWGLVRAARLHRRSTCLPRWRANVLMLSAWPARDRVMCNIWVIFARCVCTWHATQNLRDTTPLLVTGNMVPEQRWSSLRE